MTVRRGRAGRGQGAPVAQQPPRWVVPSALALTVVGLGVSIYLTVIHYAKIQPYCDLGKFINCEAVTTSPQSVVFGVPVPVFGLLFFIGMLVLQSPQAWRSAWPAIRWARIASVVVGVGFVAYLVYTELFTLDQLCLWCTGVHVITFLLFLITLLGSALVVPVQQTAPPGRRR